MQEASVPGEREAEAIRRRIARIDSQLDSIQRLAAVQGDDLRDQWDDLVRERAMLSRTIAPPADSVTSPWYLRLLSGSLVVTGALLYLSHSEGGPWLAAWFVLGLACGACLLALTRTSGRSKRRSTKKPSTKKPSPNLSLT